MCDIQSTLSESDKPYNLILFCFPTAVPSSLGIGNGVCEPVAEWSRPFLSHDTPGFDKLQQTEAGSELVPFYRTGPDLVPRRSRCLVLTV